MLSRRVAMGSSGVVVLGVLCRSAFGREEGRDAGRAGMPQDVQERMDQSRAFFERLRNAGSPEERTKIVEERNAWERSRAIADFQGQLGVSDSEWAVIKPRLEAIYDLVHPAQQSKRGDVRSMTPVEQKKSELRQLLANQDALPEQIKGALTALRTAKEKAHQDLAKARQDLRQLMTVRQEAVLVLGDLLD
jgi:chromosome segregation ATPase